MKYTKVAFASAFLISSLTPQLQAGFVDWLGTTSDDWSDNSNWQNGNGVGVDDTAEIFNSGVAMAPAAVLSGSASVNQVWLGNIGGPSESGALTVGSGASLTTVDNFIIADNSTLTSSGIISVGNSNGMIVRDTAAVTLKDDSELNKITLEGFSTVTMEAGSAVNTIQLGQDSQLTMGSSYNSTLNVNSRSSAIINGTINGALNYNTSGTGLIGENGIVTGDLGVNRSASVIVNGTVQGRISINQTSSVTLNGTCVGDFKVNGTTMSYINEDAIVQGNVTLDNDDKVTIGGNINGVGNTFHVKGSAQATILPTANILSNSNNSWIYDDAQVTWKVGADGSVATLKTSRLSSDAGLFDGQWRFDGVRTDNAGVTYTPVLIVDLTDCTVYGTPISLQLVTDIQNEDQFESLMKFYVGDTDVTDDFTYAGTGSFTGSIANPEPDADGDGLADSVETNTGIFVDASDTGTNPNSADTDGDGLSDAVETGTGVYVSATDTGSNPNLDDTDGDGLSDAVETGTGVYVSSSDTGTNRLLADSDGDTMSDFDEIQYMGLDPNTDSSTLISSLPSTGGGIEQSVYDAAVAEKVAAETALANAREARAGSTVIDVANDVATITLRVEQTSDVSDWSSATTSDHDIDLSAPAGASFYRFTIPE